MKHNMLNTNQEYNHKYNGHKTGQYNSLCYFHTDPNTFVTANKQATSNITYTLVIAV